ncbi:MAG: 16S rRNA (guanine(527)-N(7))-methyltransferase RsmG [Lapillicoccus sp.]
MPPTPQLASVVFGERVGLAERYVRELADTGTSHGLIGPRETPRLWDRHVLGCAVFHPAFPRGVTVADIGSGAGLPGIVLGIVRPDLEIVLVEPLHRRVVWLQATIETLELDNVTVYEGRAESLWGQRRFPVITARAVARIGALASWCLPLLEPGGRLVAMKGSSAASELDEDRAAVRAAGGVESGVTTYGDDLLAIPTTVVTVSVGAPAPVPPRPSQGRGRRSRR